jgi:hypothetical protein
MEYAPTAPNSTALLPRTVYAPQLRRGCRHEAAWTTKNRGQAVPFARFFVATFFCARKNASHFSLSVVKKRRKQSGLCEIWAKILKIVEKN